MQQKTMSLLTVKVVDEGSKQQGILFAQLHCRLKRLFVKVALSLRFYVHKICRGPGRS